MRNIIISTAIVLSFAMFTAKAAASGTPSLPCYVDGKSVGTLIVTECRRKGGTVFKNRIEK